MAQCQAAGRPPLFNPIQQPVQGAAKPVATSRTRPTSRSHSQANLGKSRAPSAYSHGVIPKPVAQPPEAALYMPPPMKARNRRAAKSRAKATVPAVASSSSNPNWSASATQAASQCEATPNTASQPANNYWALAKAISQQPGLKNIPVSLVMRALQIFMSKRSTTSCVADDVWPSGSGISNSMAHSESPSRPGMGIPAMEVAGSYPRSGSLSPVMQPEGSPLLEQPRFVPAIGGDDAGNPMASSVETPTQFPRWYRTMDAIPGWGMPATGLSTVEAPTTEPELPPATSQMLGDFDAIVRCGGSNVTTAVNEKNDGEEPSSAVGEYIFDIEYSLAVEAARSEAQLALPEQEDIERSFGALPNNLSPSAESRREVSMGEAGADEIDIIFNDLLDGGWENYVDFDGLGSV